MAERPNATVDAAAVMGRAIALYQRGGVDEAEALCRALLVQVPAHFDALHLLGVIHHQKGDYAVAAQLIVRAIDVKPDIAAAHSNLGSALRQLRRPVDALASFDRALQLKPDYAE